MRRSPFLSLIALCFFGSLLGCVRRGFDLQGHRGARGHRPENTLSSFRHALDIGVHTLELDAGVTADGVVVVYHDEALNPDITRSADGEWLIGPGPALRSLEYGDLSAFDVGRLRPGSPYGNLFSEQQPVDGERIPKLRDVLFMAERVSGGTVRYNVETKLTPDTKGISPEEIAEAVLRSLTAAEVLDRSTLQSFDWRTLDAVREIAKQTRGSADAIATSCLTREGDSDGDTIRRGEEGASRWTADWDIDEATSLPAMVRQSGCQIWSPSAADVTEADVARAHDLGLLVKVWTVNEPAEIDRMLDLEVDGIISDYPDRVRERMQARGMQLPQRFPLVERAPVVLPANDPLAAPSDTMPPSGTQSDE